MVVFLFYFYIFIFLFLKKRNNNFFFYTHECICSDNPKCLHEGNEKNQWTQWLFTAKLLYKIAPCAEMMIKFSIVAITPEIVFTYLAGLIFCV